MAKMVTRPGSVRDAALAKPTISRLATARLFLTIGVTGVGDTPPLLAFIEREFVDKRGVLTRDNVTEALTYTKPLPGSTVLQIVAYLGYKLGGWPASAIASVAYLLPSVLAMGLLAAGYVALTGLPNTGPALQGLTAAVVGVLVATTYRLAKRSISLREPLTLALAAGAVVAGSVFNVSAAVIAIVAGAIGMIVYTRPATAKPDAKEAQA